MVSLLNAGADAIGFATRKFGMLVAPAALGAIGGRLIGAGYRMGALQGAISGAVFSWTLRPLANLINANKGPGKDQIHQNTANILWVAGKILQIAVPVIVTVYAGDRILNAAAGLLPLSFKWLAAVDPSVSQYNTIVRALLVNIAPVCAQHFIEWLRGEDPRARGI